MNTSFVETKILNHFKQTTAIICILGLMVFQSCKNDMAKVKSISNSTNVPIQTGDNIEIIYSENAVVKAKLNAPVVKHFEKEKGKTYSEFSSGVQVLFYDSLMNVTSKLTAKYALHFESEQKMEGRNDVVVVNQKGEVLNTEHLIWDQKTEKIYSDVPVKVTTKDEILFGKRFESDQYFNKWQIIEPTGSIQLKN